MDNKKLIIVGTSNNAKLAHFYFSRDTDYEIVAFAVNSKYNVMDDFCGTPVVNLEEIKDDFPPNKFDCFVAVGYKDMNNIRLDLYNFVKNLGYHLPNYISPRCSFLSREIIGDNNFILEDNTIQPFSRIGSNNVLWSGNHVGHDVSIGDNNFITSHVVISGFTKIGNNCFLGVNSSIRDNIQISDYTLIGAGAVIMENTELEGVYLPPKSVKIRRNSLDLKISD
jgi:sugar O-acyltransferase (sialic acid O-acetyltransferase NeuD family)